MIRQFLYEIVFNFGFAQYLIYLILLLDCSIELFGAVSDIISAIALKYSTSILQHITSNKRSSGPLFLALGLQPSKVESPSTLEFLDVEPDPIPRGLVRLWMSLPSGS